MHSNRLSSFLKYIFISSLLEFCVMGFDLIYPSFLNFSQIRPHFPSCPVLCIFSQSRPICAAQTFFDVWFSTRVWSPDIVLEKQPFLSQLLTIANSSSGRSGTSCSPSIYTLLFILVWVCIDLGHTVTRVVNIYVYLSQCVQMTLLLFHYLPPLALILFLPHVCSDHWRSVYNIYVPFRDEIPLFPSLFLSQFWTSMLITVTTKRNFCSES